MYKVYDNGNEYIFKCIKPLNNINQIINYYSYTLVFIQNEDIVDIWVIKGSAYTEGLEELRKYYKLTYNGIPHYIIKTVM